MTRLIISKTAYSIGFDKDRYKSCAGLSTEERETVRRGEAAFYLDRFLSNGNSGHYLRVAYYSSGYRRRVAAKEEVADYIAQTGHNPCYIPQTDEISKQKRKAAKERRCSALQAFKKHQEEIANSEIVTPRQAGVMNFFGIEMPNGLKWPMMLLSCGDGMESLWFLKGSLGSRRNGY